MTTNVSCWSLRSSHICNLWRNTLMESTLSKVSSGRSFPCGYFVTIMPNHSLSFLQRSKNWFRWLMVKMKTKTTPKLSRIVKTRLSCHRLCRIWSRYHDPEPKPSTSDRERWLVHSVKCRMGVHRYEICWGDTGELGWFSSLIHFFLTVAWISWKALVHINCIKKYLSRCPGNLLWISSSYVLYNCLLQNNLRLKINTLRNWKLLTI